MKVIIDTEQETLTLVGATIIEYFDYFAENSMDNYTVVEDTAEGENYTDSIFVYTSTT